MSRTLFWYVFKDLLRIFALAVLALAGIMSFGGLVQTLAKQGLEASKVGQMLTYLLPAMTTYALPIAALFATTMVYGRLAADNEITACRAGGISYLSVATPAFLLGIVVSITSLLLLCFIVPRLSLQVEKIIKSNIARIVNNQIDRTHQIQFDQYTIFAQTAQIVPQDPTKPNEQAVILQGPMFVNYEPLPREDKAIGELAQKDLTGRIQKALDAKVALETRLDAVQKTAAKDDPAVRALRGQINNAQKEVDKVSREIRIPREFWMAKSATVLIRNEEDEQRVLLTAHLDDGTKFPRNFVPGVQIETGGMGAADYGPVPLASPVREHPKFMDIRQLKALYADRSQSRTIKEILASLARGEQEQLFRQRIVDQLNSAHSIRFQTTSEIYTLSLGDAPAYVLNSEVIVPSQQKNQRQVKLASVKSNAPGITGTANQIRLKVTADNENQRFIIDATLLDATVAIPDVTPPRSEFRRRINIAMPDDLVKLAGTKPELYLTSAMVSPENKQTLRNALVRLGNYIQSEINARTSFACSCLILVMMGASLGMMFKSGNFLSAFAVSVIPALICIALIVTGQHTVENIPDIVTSANNPLKLGVAIIWSGNVMVAGLGSALLWRLQLQ